VAQDEGILRQDRYPLRTSAQWLGPIVTELLESRRVLEIELNSTTGESMVFSIPTFTKEMVALTVVFE
jgi:phenylalanine ammonia-lyase